MQIVIREIHIPPGESEAKNGGKCVVPFFVLLQTEKCISVILETEHTEYLIIMHELTHKSL